LGQLESLPFIVDEQAWVYVLATAAVFRT